MDPLTGYAIGTGLLSLFGGFSKSSAYKKAGKAAREAAYANAEDLLYYSEINAGIITDAAGRNAQAQLTIGDANANAVLNATYRNLFLYGMQADEEIRRHVLSEKSLAGKIRATVSGTGIQVNTGTPLYYLNSQIDEGIRQRRFMQNKHFYTMLNIKEEGEERASIISLTASENAAVIMANAEAQADVALLDAERQAKVMQRQGDLAYQTGQANASGALFDGITSAVSAFAPAIVKYAAPASTIGVPTYLNASTPAYSTANYNYASGNWQLPSYI